MKNVWRTRGSSVLVLISTLASMGCSSSSGASDAPSGVGRGAAGSGNATGFSVGGAGNNGGSVGVAGNGGGAIGFAGGGNSPGIPLSPDAACSTSSYSGERLPLDIYFLVDTSGSMNQNVQGGTKWSTVSAALTSFLNDPANADIGVGIGYFPLVIPGVPVFCTVDTDCMTYGPCIDGVVVGSDHLFGTCSGADVCTASSYAMPSVPLQLPPNHPAVVMDLANHMPGGGTPTQPALSGSMQYVMGWAQAHIGRTSVLVLATDGEPTGCNTNTAQDVANVAASGLSGTPSIRTFVIGVGNSLQNLDTIAQAGGTQKAIIVDTGGDVGMEFASALSQIRGAAVPCEFSIPNQAGIDPSKVNVTYVPSGSQTTLTIPQTSDGTAATCGASGGWYYDNPAAPKTVKVCDGTCSAISVSTSVNFELGCTTIVAPPS